ncbi:Oidioi.mRNA.OKI2018_I69.chr2.g4481.t1.cds [Oikopleura dioica]|uniref:Oidioi.mRNA.OKI2018_I69.chr2.g4481.t1.cds n=1 Tax=Oikopleura dioica TaxID=34765 RepID=A0ABN7T2X9_OIKDI|nr:Oidioi.mRNA.OKI2018_I69.chr2.g4481.t1.cds [Oikopleura dioica]
MGIRIFLKGSLFMKCSLEILGDQVNLGEDLDLDTGIYKRRTVDNHRTSHMIQPSFLTGVRIRISFLTDETCKVRQFSFFANDKENKSKHLATFKAPKTTNTWVTYAFSKVMHTWSVQVEPKIDFKLGSDAVVRIKYQFLGYFDKGYSIGENTEGTIRLETY